MSHPGQARGSNRVQFAHILLLVFFAVLFTIVSAQFPGGTASAQSNDTSPASTNANNPKPGNISTLAGNGNREFGSGDGLDPFGMAVDGAGNVYIADLFNHRIRKVDPNGVMTTVAGNGVQGFSGDGGPAVSASLNFPHDVAIDAAGNLYIADLSNNRIRKVDPNGIISTVVGNDAGEFSGDGGPATSASLWGPKGVTIDSGGTLYIADFNNGRVRKVDANGIITTVAGNGSNE
jgi:sugar lactone lactonase YvrE